MENLGRQALCIPDGDKLMRRRLLVCTHMQKAGRRAVVRAWRGNKDFAHGRGWRKDAATLIRQCLHCIDSRNRGLVPRPLVEAVHGTAASEVVQFDFSYFGNSEVAHGNDELDGRTCVLVPLEEVSGNVWLGPAKALRPDSSWRGAQRLKLRGFGRVITEPTFGSGS